jgi:hypothetical protein
MLPRPECNCQHSETPHFLASLQPYHHARSCNVFIAWQRAADEDPIDDEPREYSLRSRKQPGDTR